MMFSEDEGGPPPEVAFNGVLRASGKRFRRQFNPNDWESSILTIRHNVLCLGMSYPCVESVIANYKGKNMQVFHSAPSVERSVELVRRKLITQIDGRDLARVVALEANNDILAYTVSKEEGAYYDQRHLNADFNSRTLVNQMHMRWGKTVRFRQVILDYFWSPSGSWAIKHWRRSFFNENIPRLVTENLLNFGELENDSVFVSALEANTAEDYISSTAAVVYLPFCSHCLSQVVACYDNLSQFYTISFLRKDQLAEHTLWKATNTISPESMIGFLAKTINQEELYCKLDARQIKHGTGDASVTKEDILDVFNKIERSDEVRMIKLTALRKFHPDYSRSDMQQAKPTLGLNKGGYVGLVGKRPAFRKKVDVTTSVITFSHKLPGKRAGETKQRTMPRKKSLSHQHLDKLVGRKEMPRMPRKRSLSCHQLDKLASRKRDKKEVSFNDDGPTPEEEPNVLTGIILEWEKMLATFESDYIKRINYGTHVPQKPPMDSQKNDNATKEHFNGPVASESAQAEQAKQSLGPINEEEDINGQVTSDSAQTAQAKLSLGPIKEVPTTKPTILDGRDPLPSAMMKVARFRRAKPAASVGGGTSAAKNDNQTQDFKQADTVETGDPLRNSEATPNVNDVLMGAYHHSHPGNVQFFNAMSICAHDFSTIADCFVDALKSLDPPGHFLGKDDSKGTWACIDYGTAIQFAPHLADHYILNTLCDNNENSSAFLSVVQQFHDAKLKGGESGNSISQLSDSSMAECRANVPQLQSIPREVNCVNESEELQENEGDTFSVPISYNENGIHKSGKAKKRRRRKGKSSVLSLALAVHEETEKINAVVTNENEGNTIDAKERGGNGKSSVLPLALAEYEETEKMNTLKETEKVDTNERDTVNDDEKDKAKQAEISMPTVAPEPEVVTESTVTTSTNTTNGNQTIGLDLSGTVTRNIMTSENICTAEDTSFRCLAEWLQASTGDTQGNVSSMEAALKQISEQGKLSAFHLLTHAFEEEEAALRSLCP